MPSTTHLIESILAIAVEMGSEPQRRQFVELACGGDAELRRRVEELIANYFTAGSFLEPPAPAADATVEEAPAAERPGAVIGPYRLLEQLGEGGFGVVYLAEQDQPVRRRVALKVLKPGMDTRQVVARFEQERQALALMDHAHIAKVFDGGETPAGRPYFVMELVKGAPITDFCDRGRLGIRERLGLFVDVCQAVQHAHQKGIIHRDLKPSNVLVTAQDTAPVVKVIDFGVAKALGQELTDKTVFTGLAQMIGTPLYMSPEQAGMSGLDVDTRSDVYSLGVLLYELLTGATPFDKGRFRQASYDEMRRIIREEEPPKPSTRLSTPGQAAQTAAARRQSDPKRLSRLLRGELDWVVMRALEKDRDRRYESASAFAADVQRYLRDEPVLACPPSVSYRLRKFARRNRGRLVAAGVLGLALLVAVGGVGWAALDKLARQARYANKLELALDRAELFQGQGQRAEALEEFGRAELLAHEAPADPARARRLAALRGRLEDDARDQEFRARFEGIRLRVESQVDLEQNSFTHEAGFPEVRDALRRYGFAVGETAPDRVAARVQGRPEAVRRDLVAALGDCLASAPRGEVQTRQWLFATLAAADKDSWRMQVRQAAAAHDEAELERLSRAADVEKQPPSFLLFLAQYLPAPMKSARLELLRRTQRAHAGDLWANHDLALELTRQGQPAEAVRYFTAALALRPDNPGIYLNRGQALWAAGERDAAIADFRQAVARAPDYLVARLSLGSRLRAIGRLDDAITEFRAALRINPRSAPAHSNLGVALLDRGRPEEALAEYREAIRLQTDFAPAHYNLGEALHRAGRLDDAAAEFREALRLKQDYALAHAGLGTVLARQGRLDDAIAALQESVRLKPDDATVHYNLGKAQFDKGRLDDAAAEFREAIRLKADYADAHLNLGSALGRKGRHDEAAAEFREVTRLQPNNPLAHCNLGHALRQQGNFREALAELRRGHELASKSPRWRYPSDRWVRQCERLVDLDGQLPGFLAGTATPAGPDERIELAKLCTLKRLHHAAARFYAEAFGAEPKLAERLDAHRYNAACAAALAGCGQGKDADKLDDKERARLRREALGWLQAELTACGRLLEGGPDAAGPTARVAGLLRHWLADADLAGVRGPEALARLPDAERQPWQALWGGVADLLARAQAKATPMKKSDAK
jgi:serine/threonine protein kinase/Flp pilus assembly protein TadD